MRSLARCLTLALVFAAIIVVRSSSPAYACSCVAIDTQMRQPESFPFDAAFVGRVSEEPDILAGGQLVWWTFLVDEVYHGDLPPTVEVKGPKAGAECGFGPISVGSQIGVLLRRDGSDWISQGCSSGPPERFALLGPPKKPFVGAPLPTVVGVQFEPEDGGLSTGALVAIAGGIALIAVAGVFAATRRRGAAT